MDLTLPFALVGLLGGFITADVISDSPWFDVEFHLWVTALALVATTALGRVLTLRAVRASRLRAVLWTIGSVIVIGPLVGAIAAFGTFGRRLVLEGLLDGLFAALAFLPVFAGIVAAARRIGRARPGSIVDAADRRAIWIIALTSLAVGSVTVPVSTPPILPCNHGLSIDASSPVTAAHALAFGAAIAIALFALGQALGMVRSSKIRALLARMRRRNRDALPPSAEEAPVFDLGLGDDEAEEVARPAAVYRGVDRVIRMVRGDLDDSRRALRRAVAWSLLALAASCAALAAHALA